MTAKSTRRRLALLCGVCLALALPARAADTDEPEPPVDEVALERVVELNKKALLAYDSLEMESAALLLRQALRVCEQAGLGKHPTAARTHLYLGIVYTSGLRLPGLGLAELRSALTIEPRIQITKSLANPEVEAAFERARSLDGAEVDAAQSLPFPTGQAPPSDDTPGTARISHPLVTRATRGQAVEIKVQVPPGLGAAKVRLAYRAQDASEFLVRELTPIPGSPTWFHEHIPAEATRGTWVAYYLEAQDAEERILAVHGTPDHPHEITLVHESAFDESGPGDRAGKARARSSAGRGLWIVFAVGSGGGYHRGSPEMNPRDVRGERIQENGIGLAKLLYLAPEIGYFQRDNLILSAQARLQFVTGAQEVHIGPKTYHPAAMAFAGLLKATWIAARPGRRFQPFAAAMLGAGQIRHALTTPASAHLTGCGSDQTCDDTILGGLAWLGVGTGFRYDLFEGLGFYAAASLLAGLPNVMITADLAAGFAVIR